MYLLTEGDVCPLPKGYPLKFFKLGVNFRLLFSAALISGIADGMIPIAFAIAAHRLHPDGSALTAVLIALWAGRVGSSMVVARLKMPTRPAMWMIASDVVRALAQALLAVWLITVGSNALAAMMVSAFAYGAATAFFNPARFGLISSLFSDQQRARVNGLLSMLGDVLFVAGPMIGTWAVLVLGFNAVLIIDAVTFLLGIAFIARFAGVRVDADTGDTEAQSDPDDPNSFAEAAKAAPQKTVGIGALPRWALWGLASWFAIYLATGFLGVGAPTWVMSRFGEAAWGIVATAAAVGSLAGSALAMTRLSELVRWPWQQAVAILLMALQIAALLVAPWLALVFAAQAAGALATTASGIRWDVNGQGLPSGALVHSFAVADELVRNVGIPAGMLLFGVSTLW